MVVNDKTKATIKKRLSIATILTATILVVGFITKVVIAYSRPISHTYQVNPENAKRWAKNEAILMESGKLSRAGDLVGAEKKMREVLKNDSGRMDVMYWLAENLEKQGKNKEAVQWYKSALMPPPGSGSTLSQNSDTWFQLAELSHRTGDSATAALSYKHVVDNAPKAEAYPTLSSANKTPSQLRALAFVAVGNQISRQGEYKKALELYQKAKAMNGRDPLVQFFLAKGLENSGKKEEARAAYHESVRFAGSNAEVSNAAQQAITEL